MGVVVWRAERVDRAGTHEAGWAILESERSPDAFDSDLRFWKAGGAWAEAPA